MVKQGPVHSHQRVGGHPRAQVAGGRAGLGGEQAGQGGGGPVERLLLPVEQGRAGGDHLVDRAEPVKRPGIAALGLRQQAAAGQQRPVKRREGRLARRPGADRLGQPVAERFKAPVEQVLLGPEVVVDGRLGDLRPARHLGDADLVEPAVDEQRPGGVGDQLPCLFLLQLAKPHSSLPINLCLL
jgi:hypothetical protein